METLQETTSAQSQAEVRSRGATALKWAVVVLAIINASFVIRRLLEIFSGWDPLLMPAITTGCEEEALFSIWKFVVGQPVYADPSNVPYAISYFNWLFYWSYGAVAKTLLGAFHLDVVWLPAIARCISFSFVCGSTAMAYAIVQQIGAWPRHWGKVVRVSFVTLCFFNKFFEFWMVTARPDVGALFCELAALWCALKYFQDRKLWSLSATVLLCYAAWAFKHNAIAVIGSLCLALMFARRWRELALVVGATFLLYALTFGLGGPLYRFAILESQKQCVISFFQCRQAVKAALTLAPYLPVSALALLGTLLFRRHLAWNASRALLCTTALISGAFMLLVSAKHGSDFNYFFAPSIYGLLWLVALYHSETVTDFTKWLRLGLPVAIFAFGVAAVSDVAVWLDQRRISARSEQTLTERQRREPRQVNPEGEALRKALLTLPAPVLVTERRFNLPWIQSRPPHFVVAYMYAADRLARRNFESGGLSNLIAHGYFKTIVTLSPLGTNTHTTVATIQAGPTIDGQKLDQYRLHHTDRYFAYYQWSSNQVSSGGAAGLPAIDAKP